MVTILSENRVSQVLNAKVSGDDLWVPIDSLEEATGWALEPQGLCRGEVCVPLSMNVQEPLLRDGDFNVSAFWRQMARPLARDPQGETWLLGDSTDELRSRLVSLEAPDFTLPDLEGRAISLRDYRGTKIFMAAWASW
jgi:hypothetical protein